VNPRGLRLLLIRSAQWTLLLGPLLAAWTLWPEGEPVPPERALSRANWEGFLSLRYAGVRRQAQGRAISTRRFEEQLRALKSAGYRPITLEEARAFLEDRSPLPEKAVLLTLEDGRRETVEEADRILASFRAPAVLLVHGEPMERGSHRYPSWHRLRVLEGSGRWSFGVRSAGELAAARRAGLFILCSQGWSGASPGDPPFGFTANGYAWNSWTRSPRGLTGLRVEPEWSAEELLRRIEPQIARGPVSSTGAPGDWVHCRGELSVQPARALLAPSSGSRGAEGWLAGTEGWRSVQGEVSLELRPGVQSWLYLRALPGRRWVRLGWTGRRIEAQVRTERDGQKLLAHGQPYPGSPRARLWFDLLERSIRFRVEGGLAPARAFPLPRALETGMAGLGVWQLDSPDRPVAFEGLRLEPRRARAAPVHDILEARALGQEPIDILAPVWGPASGDALERGAELDPALIHLAAYRGSTVWPIVRLQEFGDGSPGDLARELERLVRTPGVEGVLLDPPPALGDGSGLEGSGLEGVLASVAVGIVPEEDPEGKLDLLRLPPWLKAARILVTARKNPHLSLPPERLLFLEPSPAPRHGG
jgi:hypothetical protein